MIIKKYTNNAWVAQSPKVTYTDIVETVTPSSGDPVSIFESGKLKAAYLPDYVYGGLRFVGTLDASSSNVNVSDLAQSNSWSITDSNYEQFLGYYFVVSGAGTFEGQSDGEFDDDAWDDGVQKDSSGNIDLEVGDWIVLTGWEASNDRALYSVVNNTYATASSSQLGVIKLGYSTNNTNRNYAVQLDSSKAYVNVPWTDTNTTYSAATSSTLGLIKTGFSTDNTAREYAVALDGSNQAYVSVPWTNTTYSTATSSALGLVKVSATGNSQSLQTVSTNSSRQYAVQVDGNGIASVNVPWSDTNTTYSTATSSTLGLVKVSGTQNTQTLSQVSTTAGRQYIVQVDSSGVASVNVPWSDTNTTYTASDGLELDGTNIEMEYPLYVASSDPTGTIKPNAIAFVG